MGFDICFPENYNEFIQVGFKGLRLTAGRRPKGPYVRLGYSRMFAYVSRMLPQVGPMLALCSPMLAVCHARSAVCWPISALC